MRYFSTAALSLAALLGASSLLHAQGGQRSIWDGVYNAAQADRGKALFSQNCTRCHGEALDGRDEIPPLKGAHFMANWEGQSLADLVQRIRNTMPLDNPGSLSGVSATDIAAYLMQQNASPAGSAELANDAGVQSTIRIDAVAPSPVAAPAAAAK